MLKMLEVSQGRKDIKGRLGSAESTQRAYPAHGFEDASTIQCSQSPKRTRSMGRVGPFEDSGKLSTVTKCRKGTKLVTTQTSAWQGSQEVTPAGLSLRGASVLLYS